MINRFPQPLRGNRQALTEVLRFIGKRLIYLKNLYNVYKINFLKKVMFDLLLFDLDGTLTEPYEGITNSVAYALAKFGITVEDRRTLTAFIGPPLVESFARFYGFGEEDSLKAVTYYREYFSERGIFENAVYADIPAVLETLKARGKRLAVATSKPQAFAERILEKFSLGSYFEVVAGASMDSSRIRKGDVVRYALSLCNPDDKRRVAMIGDREQDVFGAKQNGIYSVGVLYGYGSRRELERAGADYIVKTPRDILELT